MLYSHHVHGYHNIIMPDIIVIRVSLTYESPPVFTLAAQSSRVCWARKIHSCLQTSPYVSKFCGIGSLLSCPSFTLECIFESAVQDLWLLFAFELFKPLFILTACLWTQEHYNGRTCIQDREEKGSLSSRGRAVWSWPTCLLDLILME